LVQFTNTEENIPNYHNTFIYLGIWNVHKICQHLCTIARPSKILPELRFLV
jgi:hypothetical protein